MRYLSFASLVPAGIFALADEATAVDVNIGNTGIDLVGPRAFLPAQHKNCSSRRRSTLQSGRETSFSRCLLTLLASRLGAMAMPNTFSGGHDGRGGPSKAESRATKSQFTMVNLPPACRAVLAQP